MKASRLIAGVQAIVAAAVVLLASGCAAASAHDTARGIVSGRFIREGGPLGPGGAQPRKVPLPGVVEFTTPDGHVFRVRVEVSGKFRVSLPAGRYQVAGISPGLGTGGGKLRSRQRPCSLPVSVTVSARRTTTVTVACAVP